MYRENWHCSLEHMHVAWKKNSYNVFSRFLKLESTWVVLTSRPEVSLDFSLGNEFRREGETIYESESSAMRIFFSSTNHRYRFKKNAWILSAYNGMLLQVFSSSFFFSIIFIFFSILATQKINISVVFILYPHEPSQGSFSPECIIARITVTFDRVHVASFCNISTIFFSHSRKSVNIPWDFLQHEFSNHYTRGKYDNASACVTTVTAFAFICFVESIIRHAQFGQYFELWRKITGFE